MRKRREEEEVEPRGKRRPCGSLSASDVCSGGGRRRTGRQMMRGPVAGVLGYRVATGDGWKGRAGPRGRLKDKEEDVSMKRMMGTLSCGHFLSAVHHG